MSLAFPGGLSYDNFQQGYIISIFAMWGIGVDIPRLLIRYGKAYPPVMNIHAISMLLIGLLTLMYVALQIYFYVNFNKISAMTGNTLAEFIIAIVLCFFVVIQFILGLATRAEMNKIKLSKNLMSLKRAHKVIGNGLTLLGKVLVSFMLSIFAADLIFRAWLFSMAGIAIVWIALEVVYRSQTRSVIIERFWKSKNKHLKYHLEILQNIIDRVEAFEDYKDLGVRYVIVDNSMYYIDEEFMHPGGQFIFNACNGKEINYFLKGAKPIAAGHSRHTHSKFVAKFLENRLVGEIPYEPILINQKVANQLVDWKIVATIKENASEAFIMALQTDAGFVRQSLKVQEFGKYIMMGCSTEDILSKTERPFYICTSLSTFQRNTLDRLRKYYKSYYFGDQVELEEESERKEKRLIDSQNRSSKLFLCIKQHKKGLFTRFLLNSPKDRIFNLTGPYGKGLNLKNKSSGLHVIIAAGIGVTCFLDLIAFLLQKTLYNLVSLKANGDELSRINADKINYNPLEDLRIIFVGLFTSSKQFYLDTLIKELYYLNKKHGLKKFDLLLRYQTMEDERDIRMIKDVFDQEYLERFIEDQQPDKIHFSGPAPLEKILRNVQANSKAQLNINYL